MNIPLKWFQVQFPSEVDQRDFERLLLALQGMSTPNRNDRWVFQVSGQRGTLTHFLAAPSTRVRALQAQARACIPGLVLEAVAQPVIPAKRAWRVWLSSGRRPLKRDDIESVGRGFLAAMAHARGEDVVTLQWWLGPVHRPQAVPTAHAPLLPESWLHAFGAAPAGPQPVDSELRASMRLKLGEPGWRAVGRIGISAANRARGFALLGAVAGALRTMNGPGAALGVRPLRATAMTRYRTPWRWGLALTIAELSGLLAWPLGDVGQLPVRRRPSRILPAPTRVLRQGRVLAHTPIGDRPLAMSATDARQGLHCIGPTGVGKSTVLLNLITQDMAAGRAVVVLEPKGDLIADVLARIPDSRRDDVIYLDPSDPAPAGFNPLRSPTPELAADQVLHIIAATHPDSWGPRLADTLHAALVTLARSPGASLAAVPLLLTHAGYRRRLLAAVSDPLGVGPFWSWFQGLSDGERQQVVAPVINKVRPLVVRPDLRAILGQAEPRFSLRDIFTERRILLANVNKGLLGPSSSRLLGTLLIHQLWQETLARSAVPTDKRHTVMVVVDELQDYVGTPTGIGEILSQSRGLGVAWALAHQHLGQLPPETRAAVLANARSRMVFQLETEDAAQFARGHSEIAPEDFTRLPAHEVYLRLSQDSGVTPYMSGVTQPPPPVTSDPAEIRAASAARYGVARADTDAALHALLDTPERPAPTVGSRRRPS